MTFTARVPSILLAATPLLFSLFPLAAASAQSEPAQSETEVPDTRLGHSTDGLVGLSRVGVPVAAPWLVALSAEAGYGFTESVLNLDDSHHRLSGRLAVSVQPAEFLAFGFRLDGRYDSHSVAGESDDGLVGDPRLFVRGFYDLGTVSLGAEVTLFVPGQDAPSFELGALTVDAEVLLGVRASPDLTFAINAGYRIDQTDKTVENGVVYSPGDQLALGISNSDAILLGLGGAYRLGSAELFAEFTWDMLLGDQAPSATESPLRAGLGGRFWFGDTHDLQVTARAEIGLSSRPAPSADLVPIEPRFSVFVGLAYRLPSPELPGGGAIGDGDPDPIVDPPEEDPEGDLRGTLTDPAGAALSGVDVTLLDGGEVIETEVSGEDGEYLFEDVPAGRDLVIQVEVEGYAPFEQTVRAGAGEAITITLERDLPSGQVRGVVQSFRGEAVQATIQVLPVGEETTANEDGFFEVNVAPGEYEVVITADGYREQRRTVTVEQQGVTIINVDLRQE